MTEKHLVFWRSSRLWEVVDHLNNNIECIVFQTSNQGKSDKVTADTKQTQIKTKGKKQEDPYKVFEHLQLSLEEVCKTFKVY